MSSVQHRGNIVLISEYKVNIMLTSEYKVHTETDQ